jgi:hypothetical protein
VLSRFIFTKTNLLKAPFHFNGYINTFNLLFTICFSRYFAAISDYCPSHFDDDRATRAMLGISRRAEKGGSYRTVQRFFATPLPWAELKVRFFATHLFKPDREYILAGDETVIGKSGSETFGVSRFFLHCGGK